MTELVGPPLRGSRGHLGPLPGLDYSPPCVRHLPSDPGGWGKQGADSGACMADPVSTPGKALGHHPIGKGRPVSVTDTTPGPWNLSSSQSCLP